MQPETVIKIFRAESPLISIIIPTMRTEEALSPLLNDIHRQTEKSLEVILAYRFSPSGRARNAGAAASKGKCLVFMDDDIRLGDEKVLRNLCRALLEHPDVGLAGASTLIPPDANYFRRRVGRQIPRMIYPIQNEMTDSDMVTTQCWAQRRDCFDKVGPFTELIERGVDPEYRHRVRRLGFRTIIAPQTWTYHPPPENFLEFVRQSYRNGRASARAQKLHPHLVVPVPDSGIVKRTKDRSLIFRILRSLWKILQGLVTLRWLQVCERLVYAYGYLRGKISV